MDHGTSSGHLSQATIGPPVKRHRNEFQPVIENGTPLYWNAVFLKKFIWNGAPLLIDYQQARKCNSQLIVQKKLLSKLKWDFPVKYWF